MSDRPQSERGTVNKSTADKLTDTIVKWIVRDSRLMDVVDNKGFTQVWKETLDTFYKTPPRRTLNYCGEKKKVYVHRYYLFWCDLLNTLSTAIYIKKTVV